MTREAVRPLAWRKREKMRRRRQSLSFFCVSSHLSGHTRASFVFPIYKHFSEGSCEELRQMCTDRRLRTPSQCPWQLHRESRETRVPGHFPRSLIRFKGFSAEKPYKTSLEQALGKEICGMIGEPLVKKTPKIRNGPRNIGIIAVSACAHEDRVLRGVNTSHAVWKAADRACFPEIGPEL